MFEKSKFPLEMTRPYGSRPGANKTKNGAHDVDNCRGFSPSRLSQLSLSPQTFMHREIRTRIEKLRGRLHCLDPLKAGNTSREQAQKDARACSGRLAS